jgi:hypothetical protein
MIENIHRILAPGGCYICVSHGRPETRLPYLGLKSYKWQLETLKVPKKATGGNGTTQSGSGSSLDVLERIDSESFYYVYICTKKF